MKHISEMKKNDSSIELFETPSFAVVGKYVRLSHPGDDDAKAEFWHKCKEDGTLDRLKKLPRLVPGTLLGWLGDHNPDHTVGYMVGAMTTDWNAPEGLAAKIISGELSSAVIAKGVYGADSMSIINKFDEIGYQSPYCGINCVGWWEGTLFFDDDGNHKNYSDFSCKILYEY